MAFFPFFPLVPSFPASVCRAGTFSSSPAFPFVVFEVGFADDVVAADDVAECRVVPLRVLLALDLVSGGMGGCWWCVGVCGDVVVVAMIGDDVVDVVGDGGSGEKKN